MCLRLTVMAGRVPAIYARTAGGVDGRNTPGHDGEDTIPVTVKTLWIVLARSRLGSHAE
jgi:hypothetical protein